MKRKGAITASAVVVAAGCGTRMNAGMNKIYMKLCGQPLLARTLAPFQECSAISEIILVVHQEEFVRCKQQVIDAYRFDKVKSIVAGGRERQDSVRNGLGEVDRSSSIVLIHDGARPFVTDEIIRRSIDAAAEKGAVCVGVPVKDTIKLADEEGFVAHTHERKGLWAAQTPQTFRTELIVKAHQSAVNEGFNATDDTMLVERLGERTQMIMGSYENIKITTPEDMVIAEALIEQNGWWK